VDTTINKLWNKNFIMYVIAYELAEMGSSLLRFAIPIYVLLGTGNPALLGTVLTLSWLPYVLLSLPGGLLADRFNKRHIIVLSNVLIVAANSIYIILIGNFDSFFISIVMLVLMMVLQSVQSPSSESSVFFIVPMDKYVQANSVTSVLIIGSGILAPIIAGFILSQLGLNAIVYGSLFLFIISSLLYGVLKIPFVKPEKTSGFLEAVAVDIKSGFKYIWHEQKTLRYATIGFFLYSLIFFPSSALIPSILIYNILGLGEASIGLSQGFIQVGGVLSAILINLFRSKINITKLTHLLVTGAVIQLLTLIAFILVSSELLAFIIITVGLFLSTTVLNMVSLSYFPFLAENTPEEIIGKIMAFGMTVMFSGASISLFTVGRLFRLFSNNLVIAALVLPILVITVSSAGIKELYA